VATLMLTTPLLTVVNEPPGLVPVERERYDVETATQHAGDPKAEVAIRFGSDIVVAQLAELGVRYVACSPGASFRGLHDSLVNGGVEASPELIECLHEEISVAVAHGYAKASGQPMVAAIHDVVGLQHASMAIYNAWCDRVPILLIGAGGPRDAAKRRPWIDWIHTANPQAQQIRDYVKWDDEPGSLEAATESLVRAWQLACSAPSGPTYLCLDIELQESEAPGDAAPLDPRAFAGPGPVAPGAEAITHLTAALDLLQTLPESPERLQRELMKFYRENKINPLASCWPLLLQLPVFLALFYLLRGDEFTARVRGPETADPGWLFIADQMGSSVHIVRRGWSLMRCPNPWLLPIDKEAWRLRRLLPKEECATILAIMDET
jgi:hypothetical protein